jgi:ABC-2 type transport system ATP-binding protein
VLATLGDRGAADGPDAVLADIRRDEAPALIRALVEAGVEITEARWRDADLEGVYLRTLEQTPQAQKEAI